MAAKYNYSRKLGNETFQVVNCDSFDEAIKIVEKGIKDRILLDPLRPFRENPFEAEKLPSKNPEAPISVPPTITPPITPDPNSTLASNTPVDQNNQNNENNPQQ